VIIASAMWRRLDVPGHDAAWLERRANGWYLQGTTVFQQDEEPVALEYDIECTAKWVTERGHIRGIIGEVKVDVAIERDHEGRWMLNGSEVTAVEGLYDLDYGFTPATNFNQLQRVQLEIGEARDVTVAWIDVDQSSLTVLPQRYERLGERRYAYASPTAGFEAILTLDERGFVTEYPGLWISEDLPE
jgi:uncharacterized protein